MAPASVHHVGLASRIGTDNRDGIDDGDCTAGAWQRC